MNLCLKIKSCMFCRQYADQRQTSYINNHPINVVLNLSHLSLPQFVFPWKFGNPSKQCHLCSLEVPDLFALFSSKCIITKHVTGKKIRKERIKLAEFLF